MKFEDFHIIYPLFEGWILPWDRRIIDPKDFWRCQAGFATDSGKFYDTIVALNQPFATGVSQFQGEKISTARFTWSGSKTSISWKFKLILNFQNPNWQNPILWNTHAPSFNETLPGCLSSYDASLPSSILKTLWHDFLSIKILLFHDNLS